MAATPSGATTARGLARLSTRDELTRRAALLEGARCTPCNGGGGPYPV